MLRPSRGRPVAARPQAGHAPSAGIASRLTRGHACIHDCAPGALSAPTATCQLPAPRPQHPVPHLCAKRGHGLCASSLQSVSDPTAECLPDQTPPALRATLESDPAESRPLVQSLRGFPPLSSLRVTDLAPLPCEGRLPRGRSPAQLPAERASTGAAGQGRAEPRFPAGRAARRGRAAGGPAAERAPAAAQGGPEPVRPLPLQVLGLVCVSHPAVSIEPRAGNETSASALCCSACSAGPGRATRRRTRRAARARRAPGRSQQCTGACAASRSSGAAASRTRGRTRSTPRASPGWRARSRTATPTRCCRCAGLG